MVWLSKLALFSYVYGQNPTRERLKRILYWFGDYVLSYSL